MSGSFFQALMTDIFKLRGSINRFWFFSPVAALMKFQNIKECVSTLGMRVLLLLLEPD